MPIESWLLHFGPETAFEPLAPVHLNVVCFAPKAPGVALEAVWAALNAEGEVFVTPSVYRGRPCLRAAFVNWMTAPADIDIAIAALRRVGAGA